MTASVSQLYGQRAVSEAQLVRLFAIVHGTRERPSRLGGNKRDRVNQLHEIIQRYGYDWEAVDKNTDPTLWLKECDYDQIIGELLAMKGETL